MDNLNWIEDIDYKKNLNEDGIDTFLKLTSIFSKTRIYFSTEPILEMKKEFIKKHLGNYSTREFTRILDVSEEFVRRVMRE